MSKIIELPAFIDPHVHFRTPGAEYKEDYTTGAAAAIAGGFRVVLDMPNTNPATTTKEVLDWKIEQTKDSLLKFGFQFGATNDNLDEILKVEDKIKAIKVFFGSSTGNLLVNDLKVLENLMNKTNKIITVHAEDEEIIQKNLKKYQNQNNPKIHSLIRDPDSAYSAVEKLLHLVRKTKHPVYFCHISTKGEVELIKKAKKEGLPVFAEVTPHHLFLDTSYFEKMGNFVKMNPPLRDKSDVEALWEALNEGVIDTFGSDHAPHTIKEKQQDYWAAPSGVPGTETMLPLLLDSVNKGRLSINKLVEMGSTNPSKIFDLKIDDKKTLIDLELTKEVRARELHSKCGWTPYEGMILKGWPVK